MHETRAHVGEVRWSERRCDTEYALLSLSEVGALRILESGRHATLRAPDPCAVSREGAEDRSVRSSCLGDHERFEPERCVRRTRVTGDASGGQAHARAAAKPVAGHVADDADGVPFGRRAHGITGGSAQSSNAGCVSGGQSGGSAVGSPRTPSVAGRALKRAPSEVRVHGASGSLGFAERSAEAQMYAFTPG
jgi:hypothetical protein